MRAMRVFRGLSVAALVFTFGGCGAGDGDELGRTTDGADRASETISSTIVDDAAVGSTTDDADRAAEPIDSTIAEDTATPSESTPTDNDDAGESTPPPSTDRADERRQVTGFEVPEAPAPGGRADAVLPTDGDEVIELFGALPDELIGGSKSISAQTQGDLAADYLAPDRASRYGFQALDLPNSYMGGMLRAIVEELDLDTVPEPSADMLVTLFVLSDDDYEVEAAGHDGDLDWVTLITTGSGDGIDGVEEVYTVVWGEADSPWAFMVGAPTEAGRNQLIAAFIEAAANVPDPQPKSADELAAGAALVTLDDFGAEWRSRPHIPQDGEAFRQLATSAMADQPACTAALEWVESEGVTLNGLLDVFAATSVAGADSPTCMSEAVEVEHTVMVFENAEQRAEAFRSMRQLGWVDCVLAVCSGLASAQFGAMFPGVTVSVDAAADRPLDLGDDSTALRFELTLRAPDGGGEIGVVQDVSIVAIGRAASAVVHQTFGDGVDEAQQDEVIERATERLLEQFGEPGEGGS